MIIRISEYRKMQEELLELKALIKMLMSALEREKRRYEADSYPPYTDTWEY